MLEWPEPTIGAGFSFPQTRAQEGDDASEHEIEDLKPRYRLTWRRHGSEANDDDLDKLETDNHRARHNGRQRSNLWPHQDAHHCKQRGSAAEDAERYRRNHKIAERPALDPING